MTYTEQPRDESQHQTDLNNLQRYNLFVRLVLLNTAEAWFDSTCILLSSAEWPPKWKQMDSEIWILSCLIRSDRWGRLTILATAQMYLLDTSALTIGQANVMRTIIPTKVNPVVNALTLSIGLENLKGISAADFKWSEKPSAVKPLYQFKRNQVSSSVHRALAARSRGSDDEFQLEVKLWMIGEMLKLGLPSTSVFGCRRFDSSRTNIWFK